MFFSDPKWGNGCLALLAGVAGVTLLRVALHNVNWSIPRPVGSIIVLLVSLAIVRFILNQIFD